MKGRVELASSFGDLGDLGLEEKGQRTFPALYCVTLWLVCFLQSLPLPGGSC